jgi:hypothetical protein
VICSLHPETLRSVFLTYDHGYPGCLDPNPDVGGAARPSFSLTCTMAVASLRPSNMSAAAPNAPPRQEFETKLRRHRYVTVASRLRHVPTFPECDGKNRSVLLADFSHSYSRNGTSKTLGHWIGKNYASNE